jgi:chromosome partitioning protein
MPTVITVYLSKGGVGKTTLTALIAQFLAGKGYKTVLIDYDRQGSQTSLFDIPEPREVLHRVLRREQNILDSLTPVPKSFIPVLGEQPGMLWLAGSR